MRLCSFVTLRCHCDKKAYRYSCVRSTAFRGLGGIVLLQHIDTVRLKNAFQNNVLVIIHFALHRPFVANWYTVGRRCLAKVSRQPAKPLRKHLVVRIAHGIAAEEGCRVR